LFAFYRFGMTEQTRAPWFCRTGSRNFPVVATAMAVATCFGEALFQKYFASSRGFQIALALGQAIPVGLLVRYFAIRSRRSDQEIRRRADPIR
jgi:hypothetical protein